MECTFLFSFTAHVSRYGFNPQQTLTERHAVLLVLEQYGFGFWHFEINKRWKGRFLPRHPTWNKNTSIKAAKAWHGRQGDRSELRSVPVKFSRPVFSISKKETTFHLSPLCKKLARTTASGFLSYCEQLGVLFENNTPWKKKSDRWTKFIPPSSRHSSAPDFFGIMRACQSELTLPDSLPVLIG